MVTEIPLLVALKLPTADSGPECNTQGEFKNTLWIITTRICSNTQRRKRSKLTVISCWNVVYVFYFSLQRKPRFTQTMKMHFALFGKWGGSSKEVNQGRMQKVRNDPT